jgi:hydrogenase nickel incorporation protein HypB
MMEIKVLKNILGANDQIAAGNRELLRKNGIYTLNLMASPGAGKTSLILQTVKALEGKVRIGVVEGDVSSSIDSEKIAKENVPVVQINTGGECHLEAGMVGNALSNLPLQDIDILFIENVGNLICPVEFNLGESRKMMIASVPEGDDKPFKYPSIFHAVDVVVISKIDLLPYVNFNMDAFVKTIKDINRNVEIFPVSCTTGEGIDKWASWLLAQSGK